MNRCRSSQRGLALILPALLLASGGCATELLVVRLRADAQTNQGRPLQVLVRSVPVEKYRTEPYMELAKLVTQVDKSVLRQLTIDPQDRFTRLLMLRAPRDAPVALYFFYASQNGSWKMMLPAPLPLYISVPLARNGVQVSGVQECRLGF